MRDSTAFISHPREIGTHTFAVVDHTPLQETVEFICSEYPDKKIMVATKDDSGSLPEGAFFVTPENPPRGYTADIVVWNNEFPLGMNFVECCIFPILEMKDTLCFIVQPSSS